MKITMILFISIVLIFNSCERSHRSLNSSNRSLNNPNNYPEYAPGQVLVGFVDTVSYKCIIEFFDTLDLEIMNLDLGYNFWAMADSNDIDYYKEIFSNDSTVVLFGELGVGSTYEILHITITFNGMNTLESDSIKVELVGLNIYDIKLHPKTARLSCKIGKEKYWITELLRYEFVEFAEPNYIQYGH